jgi:DNA polymerase-1
MTLHCTTPDSYDLLHRGSLALAEVERHGIRVDVPYLDAATKKVAARIARLQEKMKQDEVWKVWQKTCREPNMGSRTQLGKVLFEAMGIESPGYTAKSDKDDEKKRRHRTDEASLEKVDHPFVRRFLRVEKLKKAKSTYLDGLRREVVDGYVHPNINLHLVDTYRSSADNPNIQNVIRRLEELAKIVRRCYVPRKGRLFGEPDCAAHEWRVAACVWKDQEMVRYVKQGKDPHAEFAAEIFRCKLSEVNKGLRDCTKQQFTFPELYGSFYIKMAQHIWRWVDEHKLEVNGMPAKDWLVRQDITELGRCEPRQEPGPSTFEGHLKLVEERFNRKFSAFGKAKDPWYQEYRKNAGFPLVTGFWIGGLCSKNFTLNAIVQGPAFHIVLEWLVRLQKRLRKYRMKSLIVAEVHDSLLLDIVPKELADVVEMAQRILTVEIPRDWPWICVPLAMEWQQSEIDGSWASKRKVEVA